MCCVLCGTSAGNLLYTKDLLGTAAAETVEAILKVQAPEGASAVSAANHVATLSVGRLLDFVRFTTPRVTGYRERASGSERARVCACACACVCAGRSERHRPDVDRRGGGPCLGVGAVRPHGRWAGAGTPRVDHVLTWC